jgi:hypothetical protein
MARGVAAFSLCLALATAACVEVRPTMPTDASEPTPRAVGGLRTFLTGRSDVAMAATVPAVLGTASRVAPPAVDLALRIHNDSPQPIHLKTSGDDVHLRMALKGPGARHARVGGDATEVYHCGQWTTIAPGAHFDLPIQKLEYGGRAERMAAYFGEHGHYRLSATLVTEVARGSEPDPCDHGDPTELVAQPIDLEVGGRGARW